MDPLPEAVTLASPVQGVPHPFLQKPEVPWEKPGRWQPRFCPQRSDMVSRGAVEVWTAPCSSCRLQGGVCPFAFSSFRGTFAPSWQALPLFPKPTKMKLSPRDTLHPSSPPPTSTLEEPRDCMGLRRLIQDNHLVLRQRISNPQPSATSASLLLIKSPVHRFWDSDMDTWGGTRTGRHSAYLQVSCIPLQLSCPFPNPRTYLLA